MYSALMQYARDNKCVSDSTGSAKIVAWPTPRNGVKNYTEDTSVSVKISGDLVPFDVFHPTSTDLFNVDRILYFFALDDIVMAIHNFIHTFSDDNAANRTRFKSLLCNIQASLANKFKRYPATRFSETFVQSMIVMAATTFPEFPEMLAENSPSLMFSQALMGCLYHCITVLYYYADQTVWDDVYMFMCEIPNDIVRNSVLYAIKQNGIFPSPALWGRIATDLFRHKDPRDSLIIVFEDHLGSVLSYPMESAGAVGEGEDGVSYVLLEAMKTYHHTITPHLLHWCLHSISIHSHIFSSNVYDKVKQIDRPHNGEDSGVFSWVFMGRMLSGPLTSRQLWMFPCHPKSDVIHDTHSRSVAEENSRKAICHLILSLEQAVSKFWDRNVLDRRWCKNSALTTITTEILLTLRSHCIMNYPSDPNYTLERFMERFYCKSTNFPHYCPAVES